MELVTETLTDWDSIHKYAQRGWIFRGQSDADWRLRTSLERCCDRLGIAATELNKTEDNLFREFRRSYHLYSQHVPSPDSLLEWLSLMQHHGAPTRLLDFTYSIYVAAYFALEDADRDCAVWAMKGRWAGRESERIMRQAGKPEPDKLLRQFVEGDEQVAKRQFFEAPYLLLACPLNPFYLDERLRIQKGVFLVPGKVTASFMDNLRAMDGHDSRDNAIKVIIPHTLRIDGLNRLFDMNISRTSLFPGLDGYAESLRVYHPAFDPNRWE